MGCGGSKDTKDQKKGGAAGGAAAKDKKPDTEGDQRAADKKAAKDENKEYQAKMQFLEKVPLMKRLPKDQHPLVASVCIATDFNPKDSVIRQGENGDEFFVIRS